MAIIPAVLLSAFTVGPIFSYVAASRLSSQPIDPKTASSAIIGTYIFAQVIGGFARNYLMPKSEMPYGVQREEKIYLRTRQLNGFGHLTAGLTILALRAIGQRCHLKTPSVLETWGLYYSTQAVINVSRLVLEWGLKK